MREAILSMNKISKNFGGIKALQEVDFNINAGEILGLVGENGAGKTTLMMILAGLQKPDSGTMLLNGKQVNITNPHLARELGIGIIPQELLLVREMTVAENIFLGIERIGKSKLLNKKLMIDLASKILEKLDSKHLSPNAMVGNLSKANQQIIAIARRIQQGGIIFIMDEPTAALTERETKNLFKVIKSICSDGCSSVIFISHRLEEVLEISDRICILRDGKIVSTLNNSNDVNRKMIISLMIGSDIQEEYPHIPSIIGKEVLRIQNYNYQTRQGNIVKNISFSLHEGEIVGITGLVGVGKTELGQTLMGLNKPLTGDCYIDEIKRTIMSPIAAVKYGLGYVSEDRRGEGLILALESVYNMTISSMKQIAPHFLISHSRENELAKKYLKRLSMKEEYLFMEAQQLSGGNQQKTVLIRQVASNARIIILDEPTKGIDVGAKMEVSKIIGELSREKKALLLLSSEPREVLGISTIIYILTSNAFLGPFKRGSIDYRGLMSIEFGES